jgi:hypothetical protein
MQLRVYRSERRDWQRLQLLNQLYYQLGMFQVGCKQSAVQVPQAEDSSKWLQTVQSTGWFYSL